MLSNRQQQILHIIIEYVIKTAEPVGSKFLAENSALSVSAPTLRNEMRVLEEQGYLTHLYTSAGRIPTEKGYRAYVESLEPPILSTKTKSALESLLKQEDKTKAMKFIAKQVAEHTQNAVFVSFGTDSVYYTGLSQLFTQPEFRNYSHTINVSSIFDTVDERIDELQAKITQRPTVLIGKENPFGSMCSIVATPFGEENMFSIMGPIRMDYKKNIAIISHLTTLLS
ncbi:MAG: hypothetical protein GW939_03310 [Candidatus Magasanikbacteria bacterium]|uniref:Heat-inducible transcription repressor HrcA C-terminal domain-containing protein n=1 Tax=Candidatus Magasanikbacteria bacterium CG10_big_fil_rev_8_21_14_0_10_38_6 TaxID=1974647 RepID=A0A2M6P040_9BACT|nr:hypothetical protein [Candidatus Magasanikbacteria bacterium]NCS72110.1 hypothetical protein [Candidatus Magasanikbacteria bacterium]PIR77092.1 MAG: hypothetical protein COU30_04330 [Candidatus Magasanikbacteria bacterium CG10_big_fil_rev_8_21_14_0_10_38_6]